MSEAMTTEPVLNPDHFPEHQRKIIEVIEKVRGLGGEEYAGSTDLARRNPVKPDTAPLLTDYAARKRPEHVFEMGTAYAFSTLHIGLGSPESPITTVEFDVDVAEEAQETLNAAGLQSMVFAGTAQRAITVLKGKVDFVFIDHDKKSYLPDFVALERHLEDGAVVLADNVNDRRAECEPFVEYMFNRYADVRILPTQAGLLVATIGE